MEQAGAKKPTRFAYLVPACEPVLRTYAPLAWIALPLERFLTSQPLPPVFPLLYEAFPLHFTSFIPSRSL